MKKYLTLTINWALVFAISSLGMVVNRGPHADPTDDFSFSIAYATDSDDAHMMKEDEVAAILIDHMDRYPRSESRKLASHIIDLCKQYRFDPAFILSLIQVESGFRKNIVSYAGAMGLMQLMPATAEVVAKRYGVRYTGERSLLDPITNVSLGVAYLSELRKKYRGVSPYFAFAAYNMGPARLDRLARHKRFKPVGTKEYYEKIRRGVPGLRFYSPRQALAKPLKERGSV
jgi:hypothetical protein